MTEEPPKSTPAEFGIAETGQPPHAKIVANTVSGYAKIVVQIAIILVMTPFIIDTLGVEAFGLWSLVWAVVSLISLINLGFGAAVGKFIADARGRRDPESYRSSLATLFWTHMTEMVVVIAVVLILLPLTDHFLDAADPGEARRLFLILGVATAIQLPLSVFGGIFAGHQAWRVSNSYEVLGSLLYAAATLLLLARFPSVEALALFNLIGISLGYVFMGLHAYRTLPGVRLSLRPKYASLKRLREIWSVSAYFAIIGVASIISMRLDTIIIKGWLDLRAVAIYAVAARIAGYVAGFGIQVASTLSPVVAELHGGEDEAQLRRIWFQGTKFAFAIAAPGVLALGMLAEPLIRSWLGEEMLPATLVLQILLLNTAIIILHSNTENFLSMRGEQKRLAAIVIGGQALNVSLSIALVNALGILGVCFATVTTALVVHAGFVMHRVAKQQNVRRRHFYRKTVLPAVMPLAGSAAALYAFETLFPPSNLFEVGAGCVAGVVVFWILYWPFGMDPDDRTRFIAPLKRRFGGRPGAAGERHQP